MRLLFVVNDPAFFVSHRLPIAIGAKSAGYTVAVASPGGDGVAPIEDAGIEHIELSMHRSSKNPLGELGTISDLLRVIRGYRPDILHLITMKPVLYSGLLLRLTSVRLAVFAISGLGYSFIKQGTKARIMRTGLEAGLRLALRQPRARVIFQNPDDRDLFVNKGLISSSQVRLIRGSGTDLDAIRPLPEPSGPKVVLLPSRMLWDKGVREFVEAARLVRAELKTVRFILSGRVDTQNPAGVPQEQLEEWDREGVVEWLPHTDNIADRLASAHLVVLPSYREGLPKSLVDGAAAGRAIITTDAPGCRHAIEPGVTGLLVPPRDSRSLAQTILTLLGDDQLRQSMGAAGRALAEREYSIQTIVDRHLEIYAECPEH